ncbi:MAG: hypothetical protein LUG83_05675 [Lachnospiraceae bacterium]|nr:hypothetical protein [Lachnospiraceae bacterium]
MSWSDDLSTWKQAGKKITDNSFLPQLVDAFSRQTAAALKNLTGTMGFKTMSGYEAAEDLYQRELDKAMIKLCSGTFSKEKVLSETVHSLAESGLRSIDFKSGYSMQLDTAVRLAVRTGSSQIAARIMDNNVASTGENLIFVSKHWGARNTGTGHANHEQWQGKVYFIREGTDYSKEAERIGQNGITSLWLAIGYSADGAHQNDPLGLNGYNCRHKHYVWFEGISEFPPEEPEPEPVIINGKKYDYYAATQKMRSMERGVRALKREREALKAMKKDTKEIDARIKRRTSEYEEFCKKCGIKEKSERLRYECGTSDLKKTKAWGKAFADGDKSGLKEIVSGDTISLEEKMNAYKSFDMGNQNGYDKWMEAYYSVNEPKLTDTDKKALGVYSDGSYDAINGVLRYEKGSDQYNKICRQYGILSLDDYEKDVNNIAKAIDKFDLSEDVITHRYVPNVDYITGATSSADDIIKSIGRGYTDKGFFSTCLFEGQTRHMGGKNPIHIETLIPKSASGAYIDRYSEKKGLEFEFLLNRGTHFKILDGGERKITVGKYDSKLHKMVDKEETERYLILEVVL